MSPLLIQVNSISMHWEPTNMPDLMLDTGNRKLYETQSRNSKDSTIRLVWRLIVVCRNSSNVMPNSLSQGTMMTHLMISYVPHYFTCQPPPRSTLPPDFQLSLASQEHSKEIRGWVECGVSIFIPMAPHLRGHCWLTASFSCQVTPSTQLSALGLGDPSITLPLWIQG